MRKQFVINVLNRVISLQLLVVITILFISCNSNGSNKYSNDYIDSVNNQIELQEKHKVRVRTQSSNAWKDIKFGTTKECAKTHDIFKDAIEDTLSNSLQLSIPVKSDVKSKLGLDYLDEMRFFFNEEDSTISLIRIAGKPLRPNYMHILLSDCRKLLNFICEENLDSIEINDSINEYNYGYDASCCSFASFSTDFKKVDIVISKYSIDHDYYYGYLVSIVPNYDIDFYNLQFLESEERESSNTLWNIFWTIIKYGLIVIICFFSIIALSYFALMGGLYIAYHAIMKHLYKLEIWLEKRIGWFSDYTMAFIYAIVSLFLMALLIVLFLYGTNV